MDERKSSLFPGTRLSTQNAHLLISSGILSLDPLLGGGFPVGSVVIVEEDFGGFHAKVLLRYFLAEGLISKHSILIASQDVNPSNVLRELPAVIANDPEPDVKSEGQASGDEMKIAFRYQKLAISTNVSRDKQIGHHFDLSKTIPFSNIENSDISFWSGQTLQTGNTFLMHQAYSDLLKSITNKIKEGKFFLKDNPEKKTILRIGIHSLGSAMWLPCRNSTRGLNEHIQDLQKFLFYLRVLVRSANAVAFVTIPTYLYDEESLERCIHSSDIAIRLNSFAGTDLENNKSLQDYHGFFHLTKLAAINSLSSKHPGSMEFVFKLRRKKFSIDVLHLPPDIEAKNDNNRSSGCSGGSHNNLLEF